jgi:hypothetical protein
MREVSIEKDGRLIEPVPVDPPAKAIDQAQTIRQIFKRARLYRRMSHAVRLRVIAELDLDEIARRLHTGRSYARLLVWEGMQRLKAAAARCPKHRSNTCQCLRRGLEIEARCERCKEPFRYRILRKKSSTARAKIRRRRFCSLRCIALTYGQKRKLPATSELRSLRARGFSNREIGRLYGCVPSAIQNALSRAAP